MSGTGGSIFEITIRKRRFAVFADAASNRQLGGFENEVVSLGDGEAVLVKKRVPFRLDGLQVAIDDNAGDQEFLQEIADANGFVPVTITYVSGRTYQGQGQIEGAIQVASDNTSATITLAGTAKLTIQ